MELAGEHMNKYHLTPNCAFQEDIGKPVRCRRRCLANESRKQEYIATADWGHQSRQSVSQESTRMLRLVASISEHSPHPGPKALHAFPPPGSWTRPCTCGRINNGTAYIERDRTYRIRSAWRVRFPNLCEEKIIVLFPRSARNLSNRSIVQDEQKANH